jgi:single-stranded-DNA-specific exonuclease
VVTSFGGHRAAAGVKLAPETFADFASRFDAHCRATLLPEQKSRTHLVDAEVHLGMLSPRLVETIEEMEPFGIGNPRPLLLVSDAEVIEAPSVMGQGGKHVRLRVGQGSASLKAVGWNMAERLASLARGSRCSLLVHPMINVWQERRSVELEIRDLRVTEAIERPAELAAVPPR